MSAFENWLWRNIDSWDKKKITEAGERFVCVRIHESRLGELKAYQVVKTAEGEEEKHRIRYKERPTFFENGLMSFFGIYQRSYSDLKTIELSAGKMIVLRMKNGAITYPADDNLMFPLDIDPRPVMPATGSSPHVGRASAPPRMAAVGASSPVLFTRTMPFRSFSADAADMPFFLPSGGVIPPIFASLVEDSHYQVAKDAKNPAKKALASIPDDVTVDPKI